MSKHEFNFKYWFVVNIYVLFYLYKSRSSTTLKITVHLLEISIRMSVTTM